MRSRYGALASVLAVGLGLLASACSATQGDPPGVVVAVGAENEYANVIQQVGGKYVQVSAIMSNPNTDPHTFEASASVAREVSAAQLVVQNGVGYDTFMNTIENAAPSSARKVITVANAAAFVDSLTGWKNAIAAFKAKYADTPVATTEPVADYMLQAAGADNVTPWALQADIMNGTDPSAQDVAIQRSLFTQHKVKVFLYNQQVTDSLTESFIALAKANGIPVVGVYETMPVPGYDYQSWMLAEVKDLQKAVASGVSSERL
jgi:zinc/manganese transport system substrate-binding protein